jgi:hypothetical protein
MTWKEFGWLVAVLVPVVVLQIVIGPIAAGVWPDGRVEEAVATVLERGQGAGRWLLDVRHRNTLHEELAGTVGAPNR